MSLCLSTDNYFSGELKFLKLSNKAKTLNLTTGFIQKNNLQKRSTSNFRVSLFPTPLPQEIIVICQVSLLLMILEVLSTFCD